MAIKGGQILHVGNGVSVIDRVQTGGPGQLNIPTEKINELGNYKSVATIRDTPDLTFSLESLDVSTEIEALITRAYGGREVSDADMTVADNTLTSLTAAFTSDDVGRQVVVAGAGANGGDLVTTIDTVTSATEAELADPSVGAVTGADLRITVGGIDLALAKPTDFASQFKAGRDAAEPFRVVCGVAIPYLNLESVSYRFGLRDNATQTVNFRGDSIFYSPGGVYVQEVAGTGTADQEIVTDHPAFEVAEGDARRILSITAGSKRLAFGADYTEAYGAVAGGAAVTTVTLDEAVATTEMVRVVYASPDVLTYDQSVHADPAVKPAAVKGRDIEIYVGGYDPADHAGSAVNKLASVQSVGVDWRVTLDRDEELGNHYAVAQDHLDVPAVTGSVDIKPRDPADLTALIRKFQGVADATKVLGPSSAVPLPLDILIKHPDTGAVLKRLHVPDARFTTPGYQGRAAQKATVTVPFESDEGSLLVFER
jgi:hypothetical protein